MFHPRFSLLKLLGAMTFIAIAVALCIPDREWAAEQRALQTIAAQGAVVRVYSTGVQIDFSQNESPTHSFTACGGELLRTLEATGRAADFDDDDLQLLTRIRKLRQLNVEGTSVSPTGQLQIHRLYFQQLFAS